MGFCGHCLIVSVDRYASSKISDLGARVVADGDAVADTLSDTGLCGYRKDRIIRLQGDKAKQIAIIQALEDLAKRVGPDDPVLLYFSGHGAAAASGSKDDSSLLAYDFDPGTGTGRLTSAMLERAWKAVPSERKLAAIDACFSGGLSLGKSDGKEFKLGLDPIILDKLASGKGNVAIASSRANEVSLILTKDPLSLFTKHVVNGLRGAAGHDGDGFVRVFDLFTYVAGAVQLEAPQQHPVYSATHQDENFPISYCSVPTRRKTRTSLTSFPTTVSELKILTELFSILYPHGPLDQAIWERAGGDPSRLALTGQGRTDWFRAIQTVLKGGGGSAITRSTLLEETKIDFPHHPDVARLVH